MVSMHIVLCSSNTLHTSGRQSITQSLFSAMTSRTDVNVVPYMLPPCSEPTQTNIGELRGHTKMQKLSKKKKKQKNLYPGQVTRFTPKYLYTYSSVQKSSREDISFGVANSDSRWRHCDMIVFYFLFKKCFYILEDTLGKRKRNILPMSRNSFSSTPFVIRSCATNQQDCPSTSYSPIGRLVTVIATFTIYFTANC